MIFDDSFYYFAWLISLFSLTHFIIFSDSFHYFAWVITWVIPLLYLAFLLSGSFHPQISVKASRTSLYLKIKFESELTIKQVVPVRRKTCY